MRLGFQVISNVQNVNSYWVPVSYTLYLGNPDTLYFQLVNLDIKDKYGNYQRFQPATDAFITVQFNSIDSNHNLNKIAVQPFPISLSTGCDPSIWDVPILAGDQIAFNSMVVTLVTGGQTYTLLPVNELVSGNTNSNQFFC
jgi:hypothetical protein